MTSRMTSLYCVAYTAKAERAVAKAGAKAGR